MELDEVEAFYALENAPCEMSLVENGPERFP